MAASPDGRIIQWMKETLSSRGDLQSFSWYTMPDFDARTLSALAARIWVTDKNPPNPGFGFQDIYRHELKIVVGVTIPWDVTGNESERQIHVVEHEIRQALIENREPTITGITVEDMHPGSVRFQVILSEDMQMLADGMEMDVNCSYTEVTA